LSRNKEMQSKSCIFKFVPKIYQYRHSKGSLPMKKIWLIIPLESPETDKYVLKMYLLFSYFIILTVTWEYYFLFSLLTPCCFNHCYFPKISNIEHCHFYKFKVNTKTLPLIRFDHTMHIWNFISYDIIGGKW
jgi:hypothetical protein